MGKQMVEAEIRPERPQVLPQMIERSDSNEHPRRNGPSGVGAGICVSAGLAGGVRSLMRTGLHCKFPVNREKYRETSDFHALKGLEGAVPQ
jgi:hypothetical protein